MVFKVCMHEPSDEVTAAFISGVYDGRKFLGVRDGQTRRDYVTLTLA